MRWPRRAFIRWSNTWHPAGKLRENGLLQPLAWAQASLAVARDGGAVVVWGESDAFWASTYTRSAGWAVPEVLEMVANHAAPALALDNSGNGVAAWSTPADEVHVRRYLRGVGWSDLVSFSLRKEAAADVTANVGAVTVAASGSGNAIVAWLETWGFASRGVQMRHLVPDD